MKNRFEGKKLLVLGARSLGSFDIVEYAKSLGAYVIITDYPEVDDLPVKHLADEYWLISTADQEVLYKKAFDCQLDGVVSGVHEFNLSIAMELAERLNLPFYANRKQWDICSNKDRFKELCLQFDIPVVSGIEIDKQSELSEVKGLNFPVIVKPIDSSGGRGISICDDEQALMGGYARAMAHSKNKKILVEPYLYAREATIYGTAQDGQIHLDMMADRHVKVLDEGFIPVSVALVFPSKHLSRYVDTLHEKVKNMFRSIGIENGSFFIQSFVTENEFIIYEMGYRLSGLLQYKIMKAINGLSQLEMQVNYALTGKMHDESIGDFINPFFNKWGFMVNFAVKPGLIGRINGIEGVRNMEQIIDVVVVHGVGANIDENTRGTLKQVAIKVYATARSKTEMLALMNKIFDQIQVYSTDNESMLLDTRYTDELAQYYD